MLTVRLLGQFDVQRNGAPVEIPSRPAQSLLAYLMLNAGTAQRRERLAGMLWPDASECNARSYLRHALWRVRKAIGAAYILSDRVSITFDVRAEYWLDSAVLESQPLEGGSADDLIEAASVYAGELLPGFYEEWVTWERERLNAVYEDRVQVLLERLVAEERWRETCEWAERWIAGGQVPEPAYRALMLAHAGLGDQAGMGATYQRCVEALEAELGVPPSQETVQLHQRLSAGEKPSRATATRESIARESIAPEPGEERTALHDRYRLDSELGGGSMGVVYRAHDTLLQRPVAVKLISDAVLDSAARARLLHEAQIAAQLNHPNIVSVHDAGDADGAPFIVMELVEGQSLHEYRPQDLDEVLAITRQVCRALEHAHANGVVHRDLKPENVLVAPDGMAKLGDFGLARSVASRLTSEGTLVGTVFYLAPELALGEEFDGRADLYSLGVMLYELTTGRLPFTADDPLAVISQHLHTPVVAPRARNPQLPPTLDGLILRLLSKNPGDRPTTATEVLDILNSPNLYQIIKDKTAMPPVPSAAAAPKHNLPTPPTPFVGREALLAEIATRLQEPACRLLTLVGPGGCGKTRLALEAAAARVDAHEHGVSFVSLAPLEAVEEIVPTVARAVGFTFYGTAEGGETVAPRQQLLDYLRNKSMLLVMDNYEHLLVPPTGGEVKGGELLADILQTAPQVKILATSRANLNLPQEHRFPIPGMEFPDPGALERATDYSAVKLFLEAARRAQPRFAASAENLRDVIHICRLVEGMPLGVLLAAGWVPMLSLAEIIVEIEHSLDFLQTDLRGVPERQRSVRAVFDHSWRLLTDQEQDVLGQMSVFRGGFTRRAAQAVTGATLRHLKGLVDKSLVDHTVTERYQLHELLRQYAADRLRRAERLVRAPERPEATRDRHGAYYAGFLARRAEQLKGARQQAALAEIEADADNARAAWDWAVKWGQVEWLDQGMEGLCLFYERTGRYEQGERACRRAAERLAEIGASAGVPAGYKVPPGCGARVQARALTWRAVYHDHLGRYESARQLLRSSGSLLDEPALADVDCRRERAFILRQEGNVTMRLGERERARGLFEHSLALYRELGDRWGTATALVGLGWSAHSLGAYAVAEGCHREGLALRRALGDRTGIADALSELSSSLRQQGQIEESERLAREAITVARETASQVNLAWGLHSLSSTLDLLGQFAEAHSLLTEAKALWEDLGSRAWLATAIVGLGVRQAHLGRYADARDQAQLSLRLGRDTGYHGVIKNSLQLLSFIALAEEAYAEAQRWSQEAFTVAQATGQQNLCLPITSMGFAERGLGNRRQALEHYGEALRTAIQRGASIYDLQRLGALAALLLADEGNVERALERYTLVSDHPHVANSQWWEDVAGKHIAAVAATLPPDVVAAAQERGRARDLQATLEELLDELEG